MENSTPTIQDIFKRFYPLYLDKHSPSGKQAKTAFHILNCKTGAYGSNISRCKRCDYAQFHHNSCRDRGCPMCQEFSKELWLDAQREYLLDTTYYHVVFTVPHELNPLFYCNQEELYGLLFQAAAQTMLELSWDPKLLGAKPGFISILHTWGTEMGYHPHLHLLAIGGGLDSQGCWHAKENGFFLPVQAASKLFRGKFLSMLKELKENGKIVFYGEAEKYQNHYEYKALLDTCYKKEWIPYFKESFAGAESVMEYIGRYTHRIAISNSRILSMDEGSVTFRAKDYKNGGKWKETTLSGVEFIRRFLMHVLPERFVKIRHYGLLSNRTKKDKIPLCRNLIGCRKFLSRFKGLEKAQIIKLLYGKDILVCPCCGEKLSTEKYNVPNRYRVSVT